MNLIDLAETGVVPDVLVRLGIRRLLASRLQSSSTSGFTDGGDRMADFTQQLRNSSLAVATDAANEQHYEVPAEFYELVLGPRLKYSSCYFETPQTSLAEAENEMLRQTCVRAEIEDCTRVLELGCGWGSLTLWIAEHFPHCQITAVSNSSSQREFIEDRAQQRGLSNIRVITADMRDFNIDEKFDRVVSVEMFEHMRNYELLFRRVSSWLAPEGKAFVHVFCHRQAPYLFETEGSANWMGRHFFTGGMMPSEDLFSHFADALSIEHQWRVNGLHYYRTCEAWLENLDRNRAAILECFRRDLPAGEARKSLQRWRMFSWPVPNFSVIELVMSGSWLTICSRTRRTATSPTNRRVCSMPGKQCGPSSGQAFQEGQDGSHDTCNVVLRNPDRDARGHDVCFAGPQHIQCRAGTDIRSLVSGDIGRCLLWVHHFLRVGCLQRTGHRSKGDLVCTDHGARQYRDVGLRSDSDIPRRPHERDRVNPAPRMR